MLSALSGKRAGRPLANSIGCTVEVHTIYFIVFHQKAIEGKPDECIHLSSHEAFRCAILADYIVHCLDVQDKLTGYSSYPKPNESPIAESRNIESVLCVMVCRSGVHMN